MAGALIHVVIGVAFLDTLAQLPLIAPYAERLGASSFGVGAVVGIYSVANMLANVGLGPLIDRWGRRRSMTAGLCTAAIALALYPHASSVGALVAFRGLHGLGGGLLVPAAFAYAADRAVPVHGGQAMARVGIAIGCAALLGPAAGGLLAGPLGYGGVFRLLSVLMVFTAVLVFRALPAHGPAPSRPSLADLGRYREMLARAGLRGALSAVFALTFSKGVLAMAFPLRAQALGYSSGQVGGLLSVFAGAAVLTFAVGGRTSRLRDETRLLVGLFLGALALAALSAAGGWLALPTSLAAFGVGFGLVFASSAAKVAALFPSERGRGFALYHACFSLGLIAGPLLSGALHERWEVSPFVVAAAMMFSWGVLLSWQLRRR